MDVFTKGALWDYWKMSGDEIDVSDDESSDLEEYRSDKEEIIKIFKIETDVFEYETPLCLTFNEFNYILKVDPDLCTKDIMGFKTYEDYKDDWIYEWNKDIPWVDEKPWTEAGLERGWLLLMEEINPGKGLDSDDELGNDLLEKMEEP
ncbi:hypothetical protein Tco_0213355 [Tanacetum coccineum]